jgi:hypothetical protein
LIDVVVETATCRMTDARNNGQCTSRAYTKYMEEAPYFTLHVSHVRIVASANGRIPQVQ